MTEVAEELGISHQALSERLRRGHGRLVRNALVVGAASPEKKR
jgi:predicted DNA binding protein